MFYAYRDTCVRHFSCSFHASHAHFYCLQLITFTIMRFTRVNMRSIFPPDSDTHTAIKNDTRHPIPFPYTRIHVTDEAYTHRLCAYLKFLLSDFTTVNIWYLRMRALSCDTRKYALCAYNFYKVHVCNHPTSTIMHLNDATTGAELYIIFFRTTRTKNK